MTLLRRHSGHRIPRPNSPLPWHRRALRRTVSFFTHNAVMTVALLAAIVTACFVPPDRAYLSYFDYKTLTCLFCVLAVVCALKNVRFFYLLAQTIVARFRRARWCVLALVYITFIGSMLIANDMALLTFLPLGYFVLHAAKMEKYLCVTFILQNIAANLGGMLTPFGNPQNLYLYTKFAIPNGTFMRIMALPFAFAIVLITLCCILFVRGEPITVPEKKERMPRRRTALYLCLFALSVAIVFRSIPYPVGLVVIVAVLLLCDRGALRSVDYPLLLTFVFFFIFSGNLSRIEAVQAFFSTLLAKNPLLVSTLSCQIISNVPSAILLSQFVVDYRPLLLGVNIGGVGTLISSLASLITFREFTHLHPEKTKSYLLWFSAFNFAFLILLYLFCALL